jgi:hypothetical protein
MQSCGQISLDPDPQAELDRMRDGSLQSSKGTLLDETRLSIGGMPARRIVMDIPEGRTVGMVVLSGNRIFHVIVVVPAGWEDGPDVKRLSQFLCVGIAMRGSIFHAESQSN